MNRNIFREYDIRGIAERDMSDGFARSLGRAIGTFQKRKGNQRIALGRDCRLSSPRLHAALKEGLLETGLHVVDVGMGPTPLMYFAVFQLDLDGGVQITGSHNPPEDNGFKMMAGKQTLHGQDIQALATMIENRDYDLTGEGSAEDVDLIPAYAGYMRGNIRLARSDLRFAIDAGNGAAGPLALAAMEACGLSPIALYCEPDGNFPAHHPDPSQPENLAALRDTVREQRLSLGIAYDGDGDRLGVIDGAGNVLWGDRLMVLFSRGILRDHPGATIIGEVKCSQTMYDDIARHGGRPIQWKTGHSLIKAKMKEEGALLAGEMSGHMFFADRYYGFDDAVYATLRLLELVSEDDQTLAERLADLPATFATPELRVECPDEEKFGVVERVREHFRKSHKVVEVDGARILFDGGWGLVRASNTQPVLVLRFEAESEARRDELRAEVEAIVAQARG